MIIKEGNLVLYNPFLINIVTNLSLVVLINILQPKNNVVLVENLHLNLDLLPIFIQQLNFNSSWLLCEQW